MPRQLYARAEGLSNTAVAVTVDFWSASSISWVPPPHDHEDPF